MAERGVSELDVRHILETGESIEEYPSDRPFPSRLMVGRCGERPLHVVVAENREQETSVVITVYEPDPEKWQPDFRKRRQP